jgi:hypothetical protein
VPHPVAVHEPDAGVRRDVEHPAVDVRRDAGHHRRRRRPQPFRPEPADHVVVGADATGGEDDGLGGQLEVAHDVAVRGGTARAVVGREEGTADAGHRAAGDHELVDAVPVVEADEPAGGGLQRAADERIDDARAGAPRDVEPGHGVAVTARAQVTALRPADRGQPAEPERRQPRTLLAGGELDVGPGPTDGEGVLVVEPVELRAALPVAPGELGRVVHAQPPLLRSVDQEQPTERPPGLAAEVGGALLVDEHDALTAGGQLVGGDQTGQAGTDHDDVGIHIDILPCQIPRAERRHEQSSSDVADREAGPRGCHAARRVRKHRPGS